MSDLKIGSSCGPSIVVAKEKRGLWWYVRLRCTCEHHTERWVAVGMLKRHAPTGCSKCWRARRDAALDKAIERS